MYLLVMSCICCVLFYFCLFFFLMIRRPPRSTRTDTLFPYTTLFRSRRRFGRLDDLHLRRGDHAPLPARHFIDARDARPQQEEDEAGGGGDHDLLAAAETLPKFDGSHDHGPARSEERRVGKEGVSTCRSRWYPYH